jgi:hypothetical protein
MNSQSTPTTVIDGEIIISFHRQRIGENLGLLPFGAILL